MDCIVHGVTAKNWTRLSDFHFQFQTGNLGFPGGSVVKSLPAMQEIRIQFWVRKIPRQRKWQPTPVFLPGKSHGQRSLAGYSPWGRKRVGQDLVSEQQEQTGKLRE